MLSRASRRSGPFSLSHLEPEIHDHTLLLCVNAFKDKLIDAPPGAMRDLELLPRAAGFSGAQFVSLAIESGAANIVCIVANWFVEARGCAAWRPFCGSLRPSTERPVYTFFFKFAVRASPPHRRLLRVLARVGADGASRQLWALAAMVAELVARWLDGLGSQPVIGSGNELRPPSTGQPPLPPSPGLTVKSPQSAGDAKL
jgi:hypothetical protein